VKNEKKGKEKNGRGKGKTKRGEKKRKGRMKGKPLRASANNVQIAYLDAPLNY
jgi:hypothetical protein